MLKIIILFLLPLFAFGQAKPSCPPESFLIEYRSPTTKGMKYTCAYLKDGKTIKHGEEWSLDIQDQVISKVNYVNGEVSQLPAQVMAPPVSSAEEEKKVLKTITDFLKVLSFQTQGVSTSKFKVENCDRDSMAWVKAAMMKTTLQRSYAFNEKCDVAGTFFAKFGEEFPMRFNLRNLDDLDFTQLKLMMDFELKSGAILYKFEVLDGKLSSASKTARFTARYQIEVNPVTGEPAKNSQKGELNLIEFNGKEVKASVPLAYD